VRVIRGQTDIFREILFVLPSGSSEPPQRHRKEAVAKGLATKRERGELKEAATKGAATRKREREESPKGMTLPTIIAPPQINP